MSSCHGQPSIAQIKDVNKSLQTLHWDKSFLAMVKDICNMAIELRAVHAENRRLRSKNIFLERKLKL